MNTTDKSINTFMTNKRTHLGPQKTWTQLKRTQAQLAMGKITNTCNTFNEHEHN